MTIEIKQDDYVKILIIAIFFIALNFILTIPKMHIPVVKFNPKDSVMENFYPNFKNIKK